MGSLKNVSPFGPAVWPVIANIYTNIYSYMSEEFDDIVNIVIYIYLFVCPILTHESWAPELICLNFFVTRR